MVKIEIVFVGLIYQYFKRFFKLKQAAGQEIDDNTDSLWYYPYR
jgi:hypothetical protein